MDEKFKDQINLTNQTTQVPIPYTPQINSNKKSPIRFLLVLMGSIELALLFALSPIDELVGIFEFEKTIFYLIVKITIAVFANTQILLGILFIWRYQSYNGFLKKISITSIIATPSFMLLTFPLLIFSSIFKVYDEMENTVCTLEAKICPDGSSVGRTGPNCEFAPCPIMVPLESNQTATPSSQMQIPELGIELTLPDELLDLRYHIEEYENSTAALFTTESLAAKFPNCEFPDGGIGWITRVEEMTAIHNKKIGNYYYGIEQAKDVCSRSPGSQEADSLETLQEALFISLFETIKSL